MIKRLFLVLTFTSGGASLGFAKDLVYQLSDQNAARQIVFESRAPVENIEGTASQLQGFITLHEESTSFFISGEAQVDVRSMNTGILLRDQHLQSSDWLDAGSFPTIRLSISPSGRQSLTKTGPASWAGHVTGQFFLKGKTKNLTFPVTIKRKTDGEQERLHLSTRFTVRLDEFGIHGPPAMKMIGAKVSPDVAIQVKAVGRSVRGSKGR